LACSILTGALAALAASHTESQKARVIVEALDERSRPAPAVGGALRDVVAQSEVLGLVPAPEESKALSAAQDRWLNAMTGAHRACEFRASDSTPYVLRVKINGLAKQKEVVLTLLSGEVSCVIASVTEPFEPASAKVGLKTALLALVAKLPGASEAADETPDAPPSPSLPEMVQVPGGAFYRGCNDALDGACDRHEAPGAKLNLAPFDLDTTEVTVAAYTECVKAGRCSAVANFSPTCNWGVPHRDRHPINCVTWDQAREYCEYVHKRLPTEAEWEKAARGTDGRVYPWGNAPASCDYAVMGQTGVNGCGRGKGTWAVGSKPKGVSPYGALDMAGNVAEWVADWYDGAYYQSAPSKNPAGPSSGTMRLFRGGSYYDGTREIRVSHRERREPGLRNGAIGFRCARSSSGASQ
jgi:formylglycine-generating enzyme required for sulfatase activity